MSKSTHVVVTRAISGVRIREGEQLQVQAESTVGPVTVTFRTRYADEGFESPVARELWVEASGEAECALDEAINAYWSVSNGLVPALAVVTNAPVDDLDVHLAFDATAGENEHAFFENFQPDEAGRPRDGRSAPLPETVTFLDAVAESDEQPRLTRACAFYREALRYLRPGQEVPFIVFAWMAVEALTKVALRRACAMEWCTEDELVVRWGLAADGADEETIKKAKRSLDGEARRRLIFHGDADCQRITVQASDGFEHGFEAFDKVRAWAVEAKERGAAEHVRLAIFELLQLPKETTATLTGGRYGKPRENWLLTKYLRGTFIGPADQLAAPDQQYPLLRWEGRMSAHRRKEDGTHEISFEEKPTVICGEGVQFRPGSFEVWGPENDPLT
jgi:hypothetical protein